MENVQEDQRGAVMLAAGIMAWMDGDIDCARSASARAPRTAALAATNAGRQRP